MKPRQPENNGPDSIDETIDAPRSEDHDFISELRPFKSLNSDIRKLILSGMVERSFEPGEPLMQQGEPGTSLMVVAGGEVEVSVEEEEGERHVLKRAHVGEVLGEMSLLTDEARSASVTALTPVRVLVLSAERFHELTERHPKISALLTLLLASRLGKAPYDALSGKSFHGYRIKHCLGRGGMSVVYEAEGPDSQRVALKMMSHRLLCDPDAMQRFRHEATIVESFDHPNIVKTYGRFEAFRTSFMIMEFCEGISLARAIKSRGRLPEPVARKVLGQVARAVAHAHEAGILHRDIKPANIMATRDGIVKLVDFGMAGRLDDDSVTVSLLGTPRYMAPEQMTGEKQETAVDLFALGHVAFEMLSGKPLFEGTSFWAIRDEVLQCRIPDLSTSLPDASLEFRRMLEGLLVREPEARHLDFDLVRSWAAPVDLESPQA